MPHLILIGGLAAAGKTTLGREIARLTRFAFLDKDRLTQPLVEALLSALDVPGGIDDRHSETYLNQVRPYEYECFMNTVIENVTLGISTIAVAPFLREIVDSLWLDEMHQQLPEASIHKVWIDTLDKVLHERLLKRNLPRDRHKIENWNAYITSYRQIRPVEPCVIVKPDQDEHPSASAMRVLGMLDIAS